MKNLFLVLTVAFLSIATSCSSEQKTENKVTSLEKEAIAEPIANKELTIEVMGMVCEKGCGGSIRKEMKATNGVTKCSFDFEDKREVNVATIAFDDSKVTEEEIILALTTMNEHQFTVGEHVVKSLK